MDRLLSLPAFQLGRQRRGFTDERHLWPAWFHLIDQRRPCTVFGEQVASKDGLPWLDLVCSDLEDTGYAVAPFDICAAGIGAPHIRQRLWFVAHAEGGGSGAGLRGNGQAGSRGIISANNGAAYGLCHTLREGLEGHAGHGGPAQGWKESFGPASETGDFSGLAEAEQINTGERGRTGSKEGARIQCGIVANGRSVLGAERPGPVNGLWRDADWLLCRDGKWRPVEPGTFPLAHGVPARVGRLRAYGNAIVPEVAAEFVRAYMFKE